MCSYCLVCMSLKIDMTSLLNEQYYLKGSCPCHLIMESNNLLFTSFRTIHWFGWQLFCSYNSAVLIKSCPVAMKIRGKEEGCKEGRNERRNKGRRLISLFLFFCSELFLIEAIGQYRSSFYSIFWPSTPSRDLVR